MNAREIRTRTQGKPVGACIYCGQNEGLTDEHVIPLGLGGLFVLPKASCRACAEITSRIERAVLRGFMLDARSAGGLPTRHPKNRPATTPLQILRGDEFEEIHLQPDQSPGLLLLPLLGRAAFLSGDPPVTGVNVVGYETIGFGTKKPQDVALTLGTTAIRTSRNWEITEFVRMLAKIGYGYAVAEGGPIPLDEVPVLPLILGTADDGGTWVGSAEYRLSVEDKRPNHALGAVQLSAIVDGVTEHVIVARVKLFSNAGATGYEVVVRRTRVPT